jgi:hypothetical protein
MGARQLVVQEALETMVMSLVYFWLLTPITNMGASSLAGQEMMVFLAPPFKWRLHLALSVKTPLDSQM